MTPARRLRVLLAAERRRGTPFDLAWERALTRIEREDWEAALAWSRPEWRLAYERGRGRLEALGPLERQGGGAEVLG